MSAAMPSMIAGRSTRMEVLELIRRKGSASAEAIASDLGVTPNAIRQHLTNLERDGFVVSHPERRARGRPSLLFSLTERAHSVFPKRYGQLATMVLQEVQELSGPEALDEIFSRVAVQARALNAADGCKAAPAMEVSGGGQAIARVVADAAHHRGAAIASARRLPARALHQPVERDAETLGREPIELPDLRASQRQRVLH